MSDIHDSRAPKPGQVSFRRLVLWMLLAVALIAGVVLFFRYGTAISPVLGDGR